MATDVRVSKYTGKWDFLITDGVKYIGNDLLEAI